MTITIEQIKTREQMADVMEWGEELNKLGKQMNIYAPTKNAPVYTVVLLDENGNGLDHVTGDTELECRLCLMQMWAKLTAGENNDD